jgi:hypothetical protein
VAGPPPFGVFLFICSAGTPFAAILSASRAVSIFTLYHTDTDIIFKGIYCLFQKGGFTSPRAAHKVLVRTLVILKNLPILLCYPVIGLKDVPNYWYFHFLLNLHVYSILYISAILLHL